MTRIQRMLVGAAVVSMAMTGWLLPTAKKTKEVQGRGGGLSADELTPTPPMGWNSFDSYCGHITEEEVKQNTDYLAKHLAKYGWQYVVVDFYWYFSSPLVNEQHRADEFEVMMDEYGRLTPATNRFPSAAGGRGFKPLADYVHSKGLKFGIHIMRGIPRQAVKRNLPIMGTSSRAQDIYSPLNTCSWSTAMYGVDTTKAAGRSYYESIAALYAAWGVDYIKADDMSWGENPAGESYHAGEIEALRTAMTKSGRPMVLSLSPGPTNLANAEHVKRHAQLWRISEDVWDDWKQVKRQFELCRVWAPHIGQNHWPDADMLPLARIHLRGFEDGPRNTRLTKDEQITLMTVWSIFRSPLMIGGDLPSMDRFTLSLLTNGEILAVNQKSVNNREVLAQDNHIVWSADIPGKNEKYVAIFNLGDDAPSEISVKLSDIGLPDRCTVRDLWEKKSRGVVEKRFADTVRPHGARLYGLKPSN